jgi:hypothetical protein
MVDTLKEVVQKAIGEEVFVIRLPGDETQYVKNPTLEETKAILRDTLALEFRKVFKVENLEKVYTYMQEMHVRGKSIHVDFRHKVGSGVVTGETITVPFGFPSAADWEKMIGEVTTKVLGNPVEGKDWAKVGAKDKIRVRDHLKIKKDFFLEPILEKWTPDFLDWNTKHVFLPKAQQDESWFSQPYTIIPPGFVGATKYEWAALCPFDHGRIEYTVLKPHFYEYYVYSDAGFYTGRLVLTWLPREQVQVSLPEESGERLGSELWVGFLFTAKNQRPYMCSKKAIEDDYLPPKGTSGLPKSLRNLIPKKLRYWEDGKERKKKRDEIVAWCDEEIEFYSRESPEDIPKEEKLWQ